jgi:hypothetical protein
VQVVGRVGLVVVYSKGSVCVISVVFKRLEVEEEVKVRKTSAALLKRPQSGYIHMITRW